METIVQILMSRDGMSRADAEELVQELRQRVIEGEDPEDLLHEELGLEPDYIEELI